MSVNSFRDLRVWQAAMDLVEDVYRRSESFPKQEMYGLTSQLRRAAVSVPSNIAEGHTRSHSNEFLHHLSYALASLAEVETQVEIASRLNYVTQQQLSEILTKVSSVGKQLNALRNAIRKKSHPPSPGP